MPLKFKLNLTQITLFCAVFFCTHVFGDEAPKIFSRTAIVISQNAEIKTSGGTIQKLSPGEVLVVTQSNKEWRWVPLLGGWIRENDTKEPAALITFLNQAISKKPTAERYQLRGIAFQVLENYEKALADFDASLKIKADNAHIHVNRGNIFRLQKKYPQALIDLNRALVLDQSSANALHLRGLVYFENEQTQQAIADFSEAIRINGQMISALNARGIAYRKEKQIDLALDDFNQAIKSNHFVSELFSNRAGVWEEKKQFESAINDYKRALELNPSSETAHNDLAWLYVTCSDSKYRDPQAGVTHALKACELTEFGDWNLLDTLATAYHENNQRTLAVETLRKAMQKAPSAEKNQLKKKLLIFDKS
ncbi:tetratricopeptide repeat protein [uncultured Gimesia sp.]|uniref:tetratricopeptide repeat protein n=1 Tax=uncultured Gimesia sp. TaxID=1678688 RepID=UPI0026039664|nr:tetratricopeptide repeat protein [uncultured Gimesia sp.]